MTTLPILSLSPKDSEILEKIRVVDPSPVILPYQEKLKEEILSFLTDTSFSTPMNEMIDKLYRETTYINGGGYIPKDKPRYEEFKIQNSFVSTQKWEGTVLEVLNNSFIAKLERSEFDDISEEEVEIKLSEIEEDDKKLVKRGAVFSWDLGYLYVLGSTRYAASILKFSRLLNWTKKEIEIAEAEAISLRKILGIED